MQRRVKPARQRDYPARAFHVGGPLLGLTRGEVVNSGVVHHMVHIPKVGDNVVAQFQLRKVADQRSRPLTPVGGQAFESAQRLAAVQQPAYPVGQLHRTPVPR